jgi:hypothetical protein
MARHKDIGPYSVDNVSIITRSQNSKEGKVGTFMSAELRDRISKTLTGKTKGIKDPIVTCPHCNVTGGNGAMKRWHFDKCKMAK